MVAIAEVIDSVELEEDLVICLRYNPDYDNAYTTAFFHIEEETFRDAHWFNNPLLAEEDFFARIELYTFME